ncbi:protein of unknown function DUF264 [Hyphomicrobium denitrificans ATCC 51888]|uniref:Phage terminase large subunit N-terminal domain-containing protein n=1 Tax=Hyphomicrobium denitrificans (strain ATCC 51888 / DSM 1869 / NCIMB 11706 / TK 0415) TaxID=582899 RepID=D8JQ61_HYPDA|nr:phage terminase large subunit [Hyphomicrobium denitrificans]ADJ21982.1 protein of unknown function DUF264 [Hyphomicrobium denitrificans ATCC 51888]
MSVSPEINLELHPKQALALETDATEVLYGGAAGGGKSHLMRVAATLWCSAIPGLQVYLFRRVREDLIKNHMEGPKGFRAMLAPWVLCGFVRIVDDEIRFWNGSKIYLCHCKDEKDIYKYQGAEIHVLLIDELTHFTESMYRFLRSRVRMVGLKLQEAWKRRFPRILAGANPGNVGHLWVKSTFVDGAESYAVRDMEPEDGGMKRQFIRAVLEDNPSMTTDDPGYEQKLSGLGSKSLVQAMRFGDWDVIEGAFFDCWATERHVIRPFAVPELWTKLMSGDWGSAKPFSFGWWTVVSDDFEAETALGRKIVLPRGCLVRYREWYGMQTGKPNTGLKLTAEQVALGLVDREPTTEKIDYRVLDPAAFTADGGPSIADRMRDAARTKTRSLVFRRADNARVPARGAMGGWDQVRQRMIGDEEGRPMMAVFSNCLDFIRTVPALQHDQTRPEDIDTDGEDHAGDEGRYACMSRPWSRKAPAPTTAQASGYKRLNEDRNSDGWKSR